MLRALVPITEYIPTGAIKYYVACHQIMRLYDLRVITHDAVFFFDEI